MLIKLIISKIAKVSLKTWLLLFAMMVSITAGFYSGKYVKNIYTDKENSISSKFNIEYLSSEEKGKVRYKYILNYDVEDAETVGKMNLDEPLFSLIHNDVTVSSKFPSFDKSVPIPEVSKSINVKSNQVYIEDFVIKYNENLSRDVLDKVLFEARIDIERLHEGKWEPEYKTIFIKRGPNLSITNSPV